MIIKQQKIQVVPGIKHISDWVNANGYIIDQVVGYGRSIINKWVTGCGFTTLYLQNSDNVILVSPRVGLIQNKMEQFNAITPDYCFYFNREVDMKTGVQKSISQLENELTCYCHYAHQNGRPLKMLVTYDSFANMADTIERILHMDISQNFRIVVDESHCLVKDVFLKEYNNRCVLSSFISRLFQYQNILFISATPIQDYVQAIPEFQKYDVDYYELEWPNQTPVTRRLDKCKSSLDAFNQIYDHYAHNQDPNGVHTFDEIYYGNNNAEYSYEAVIFLNNVADICHILNKYINQLRLINPNDVTIICAKTKDNKRDLKKIDPTLQPCQSIPKQGEKHTTWTFCTRCAFEGIDLYSPCASTFVVANYKIASLALDIASDLHQIIGRQRLEDNHFRNILHIFHRDNSNIATDQEFQAYQRQKYNDSVKRIAMWHKVGCNLQNDLLKDLTTIIEMNPEKYYVRTINGYPEINQLLITAEQYCQDVLKNHKHLFVLSSQSQCNYSPAIIQLKTAMESAVNQTRIRQVYDFYISQPNYREELFGMLSIEGYTMIAKYFTLLPPERIMALGCNSTRLDAEIRSESLTSDASELMRDRFEVNKWYSMKDVKRIMQQVFDALGMLKTAKATDLPSYLNCQVRRNKEDRGYVIH